MTSKRYQILDGNVLLPTGLCKTNIEIENGVITKISNKIGKNVSSNNISAQGKYIIPGFIDIHTNGISGFDVTNGIYDVKQKRFYFNEKKYIAGLDLALREYAKHGTTLVCLSTLEASENKMMKIFKLIAEYKNDKSNEYNDIFHGIYMEGTFMKDKRFKGAHNPKYFFEPSKSLFKKFQNVSDTNIKIVNVVPEWGDSALRLINYLTKQNIICAAGHTSATGKEYKLAIKRGLKLAIHALNGPSSASYKSFDDGGALETFLTSDNMYIEIIPDGYHVAKPYVLDLIKRKGVDKCIAITDSMFATKLENIKEFEVNNIPGSISKNKKYLYIRGKENDNSLFGSVLTMDNAFANLLTWFTQPTQGIWNKTHQPLSFEEALLRASKLCSSNPAELLGIYSSGKNENSKNFIPSGSIDINKRADIVITDILMNKTKYKLKIDKVLSNGNLVINGKLKN